MNQPDTILLAWNPNRYTWGTLQDELTEIRRSKGGNSSWSVANRKTIKAGSRFFLIRLGKEPRGLVGSGWITSEPFEGEHWDEEKSASNKTTNYANICFDVLAELPIITISELQNRPALKGHWEIQSSGPAIPLATARGLEVLWAQRTAGSYSGGGEELPEVPASAVSHSSRVYVNRYERDTKLRALCLAHHSMRCSCCDVLLEELYGEAARDLVHVHHLTPLHKIPNGAKIDPTSDLRPVCPNCHAVIHRKDPPYTIEEVRGLLGRSNQSSKKTVKTKKWLH